MYDLTDAYARSARDWLVYHRTDTRGGLYDREACVGDVDGDGDVDLADLSALLAAFGSSCG